MESVLLACAVLVNLSGIMFESKLLALKEFRGQRDFITYFVILVIIFSIVYFAAVFISEVSLGS